MKRFIFTITDLGLFLGKSPVTLRGWERDGLVSMPRDSGGDRKLTLDNIHEVGGVAFQLGRISLRRWRLIQMVLFSLELIEKGPK